MTNSDPHQNAAPISNIVEADLRGGNGDLLGVVDELLIDLDSGRITYVLATGVHGQRLQFSWRSISIEDGNFVVRREIPRLIVDHPRDES